MHSMIIAATSATIAALSGAGFGSSVEASLVLVAFGVALIGVPHGALDPIAGQRLFSQFGSAWWVPFFGGYLALSLIVICGWYIAPVFTCLLFLAFSAWHFGLEEDYARPTKSPIFKHLYALARGSLIIFAISLFRTEETQAIFSKVMPSDSLQQTATVMSLLQLSAFVLIPLAVVDFVSWILSAGPGRMWVALRLLSIGVLAFTVNPLLSFGIYFCGWHSVRGLSELRTEVGGSFGGFIFRLVPLTAVTLLFALSAFIFWSRSAVFTASLLRTVFLGLSAIAIPHLALHTTYRLVCSSAIESRKMQGALLCR
jgi:beta-carotene 15,15'-dioxygenase